MRIYFFVALIIICSCGTSFSQEKKAIFQKVEIPKIIRLALPSYPISAFPISAEEKIKIRLRILQNGETVSSQFKTKFPPFRTVIRKALEKWKFEESDEKIREATIHFEFILLPFDSKCSISSIFELPDRS